MGNDFLVKISPSDALTILKLLTKTDEKIKNKVIELAENLLKDFDVDEICEAVFDALDELDVHELWDRAGPKTDGYVSTEEVSVEMFDEALEPFIEKMQRLLDLGMSREAKSYCMSILKGIYQYQMDSRSEFKDWASDLPAESFGDILRDWGKRSSDKEKKEMKKFIEKDCPSWFKWADNLI